ncbi:PREDICTED: uncharacterized protein LOC109174020 [Ipomoea nil]|uniref:uncharacterized protein LOC109174020 n=1 Tax=Ipomoea nil TaxID=35883 RepID=UPI000901C645|nr:PREDICTED: uncharacterized protein LOC109174020 [Ipomoea nil]
MADPVRNIIIKLGSKTHSPEVALKHIQTLLQFAMKKKLKLDPLLRDEILVTVMTYYPEFYAKWSEDDATELLMMVSETRDEVSPEILRNRSNNSETPIEISPDKPDVSATPSCVPVISENLTALDSENAPVNVDSTSLPVSESVGVKTDVLPVSDDKEESSDEPNKLSLVVYASDNIALPPAEIADDPKEVCSVVDTPILPVNVEPVDLSSPHKSEKTSGILVYTATSLGESLEHVRHFADLPSASIPQPYQVIHPSESSSEDDKILAEVYGSQTLPSVIPTVEATAHPDSTTFKIREISNIIGSSSANVSDSSHSVTPVQSPSKETRRSKRKNVPVKVVVETGDDSANVDQPEKKRKSSEGVKPEENPPIQQVFKTLRSSVKQKGLAVQVTSMPAPFVKKGKPSTRSRGRSITPEVQPVEETDPSVYRPQFVSPAAQTKWSTMTVTNICPYSKLLTYEFYCNLNDEIDVLFRPRPMQIFIRGRWYVFGPDMINEYYGLTDVQEDPVTDWNLVARTLTGGQTKSWPTRDKDYLQSSHLTSRYVILHRLALHNWLPSAHFHTVGKLLAGFLFRIGKKMPIDLGKWIYYHILTLIHPREQKGLEPMPSEVISPTLLYTVDKCLLTGDHIRDVVPVSAPSNSEPDAVSDDYPRAKDIQLSIQLKESQLIGARTELATVLLRLSLSESAAAADPAKSDSDTPSNA